MTNSNTFKISSIRGKRKVVEVFKFLPVPTGSFVMGSPTSSPELRRPMKVTRGIEMMPAQVTQGQWREVMKTEPWKKKKDIYKHSSFREGDNYPAVGVSWYDAREFAKAVSASVGRNLRLPTECEWELAARAGSKGKYAWGDNKDLYVEYAWGDRESEIIHEVAHLRPNGWGFYDMGGNVSEWVIDLCLMDNEIINRPSNHFTDENNFCSKAGSHGIVKGAACDMPGRMASPDYSQLETLDNCSPIISFRLVADDNKDGITFSQFTVTEPAEESDYAAPSMYFSLLEEPPETITEGIGVVEDYVKQLLEMERGKKLTDADKDVLKEMQKKSNLRRLIEFTDTWRKEDVLEQQIAKDMGEKYKKVSAATWKRLDSCVSELKKRL